MGVNASRAKVGASEHNALSWEHACKLKKEIQAGIEKLLYQAEDAEREEVVHCKLYFVEYSGRVCCKMPTLGRYAAIHNIEPCRTGVLTLTRMEN